MSHGYGSPSMAFSSADAYRQVDSDQRSPSIQTESNSLWLDRKDGTGSSPPPPNNQDSQWELREEVLNARLRARAGGTHSTLARHQEHARTSSIESASTPAKRDSIGSSSILHGLRSPTQDQSPFVEQYVDVPTSRSARLATRKSLLDPSDFGFDAQNGDPRLILGKELDDVEAARPTRGQTDESTVELITIPALGAEYSPGELRELKKAGRAKAALRKQREGCAAWRRGEDRICCGLSPRKLVFIVAAFLVILAVLLYFVIPRVPVFGLQTRNTLVAVPDGASMLTHHAPTNFSMDMKVTLRADNSAGWVPSHATDMKISVTDLSTMRKVGLGTMDAMSFPGRKKTIFEFPVHFAYASVNVTGDQTWAHWINACGPKYDNTPRQSLSLEFSLLMRIRGLLGERGASIQLNELECPFTLQPE